MLLWKCGMCDCKKLKFITEQETRELSSSLGIRTHLSQIPLLGPLLFQKYRMNETINTILLAGDKVIQAMHLRQPWFAYSACRPYTKNK